jgi:hypothetical protein
MTKYNGRKPPNGQKEPGEMLNRLKLLTIASGLLMAAGGAQPVMAKNNPQVKPTYSMVARGKSIDGYWDTDSESGWWWWNGCSYCTDDTSCQCFYSDGTGGSGIFQVNINQYTTMSWAMELDFTTEAAVPSGADW